MKRKVLSILFVPLLALVLTSAGGAQSQTGSLSGTITDEQGSPIPFVNITLTSPALQGQQTFVCTDNGNFRFPSLPPGEYTLRAEFSGFQTTEAKGIIISLGKSINLNIQMKSAQAEEITITGLAPVVDVRQSDITVTIDKNMIKNIPVRRNILDLYRMAPGTVGQSETYDYQRQSVVHGGAVQDSKISIDGVDLYDPMRGYALGDVAFEAIEEVEISLGGHKAEVGGIMAGYVNVVSKAGGNKFSGGITGLYSGKALTQNIVTPEQVKAAKLAEPILWDYRRDVSADFGGPILKDKLWFYLSPRYTDRKKNTAFVPFTDPRGVYHPPYYFTHQDYQYLGKITASITKGLKWSGMYEYYKNLDEPDPWDVYLLQTPWEAISGHNLNDFGNIVSSILTYIINQNTFAEFRVGYVWKTLELHQYDATGPKSDLYTYDRGTGYYWGPAWGGEWYDKRSLDIKLTLTRFQDDFLGMDHEFKAGIEYGHAGSTTEGPMEDWQSSYRAYWYNGTPWNFHNTTPYMGQVGIRYGDKTLHEAPREYGVLRAGGFIQDSFTIKKRLTVNLGFRYDSYHGYKEKETFKAWIDPNKGLANILLPQIFITQDQEFQAVDDIMVFHNFSPRLGFTYDVFGNGKTALKVSLARYKEPMVGNHIEMFTAYGSGTITFNWWDDNRNGWYDLPPIDRYSPQSWSPFSTDLEKLRKQIDPNITAPYTDELILGIQHELVKDFSLGVDFVYKNVKNHQGQVNLVNPKTSSAWVPYSFTDPGPDGLFNTGDDQAMTAYMLRREAAPDVYQKTNIPEAWRRYWGIDFIFYKRMSNNWMLSANFTYSKAWGNQPHGYHSQRGSTNWDDPNLLINKVARLEFDRPLFLKVMSTVILPFNINASLYYRFSSGSPWGRMITVYFPTTLDGSAPKSPNVRIYAEPVGERSNLPDFNNFDVRFEKEFRLGPGRLGLWLEVFNLFGNYRYTYDQDPGGYVYANGTFSRYPTYGKVISVEGTRTVNIAFRYRF